MTSAQARQSIIIGTAGHVDHGKTALIQRLTGINTDRLKEEQERGLTIDLGFAWFDLPSGAHAGIVDVPGHERFVKNMLAGATGIDLFLLVVAADEGVMPQTREHLTILDTLEIEAGIVVLTKSDLVDAETLELVQEDIAEALEGTAFEGAPMVATSARTGAGFDELITLIDRVALGVSPRDIAGPTRVQVDRVFTMKGFGTVITGSLIRGRLRVGQELVVLPAGRATRVRGIEVHGSHLEECIAPARVGVNLAGLSTDEVERGDQLVAPGSMKPSWMLDVRLRLSADADRPLAYRERVRIHHGAAEVLGRVVLLDSDFLAPGDRGLAQLRLETPVPAAAGDHFVIRRYSPAQTIGGGVVLDPAPARHRRRQADVLQRLEALESGAEQERARDWFASRGAQAASSEDLARGLQMDDDQAEALVDSLLESGRLVPLAPGRYLDAGVAERTLASVTEALGAYHRANPLRPHMPVPRLQTALGSPPPETLQWAVSELSAKGSVVSESGGVRLSSHTAALGPEQESALEALYRWAEEAALAPPSREEACALLAPAGDARSLLELALKSGRLVDAGEYIIAAPALEQAANALAALHAEKGPFAVADARDVWGSSRKYVVPLLEYLDGTGFTRRSGNTRTVTRPPGPREGVR